MPLELMPGWEPVQPRAAYVPSPSLVDLSEQARNGCVCSYCIQEREVHTERLRRVENIPQGSEVLLAYYVNQGRTPGRYSGPYALHGRMRWLDESTGEVYDAQGNRQWTFRNEGGVWTDGRGMDFILERPAEASPAAVQWATVHSYL